MADTRQTIAELLSQASPDTKKVIEEVFKIEREKLGKVNPYGLKDDIAAAIKDIVK